MAQEDKVLQQFWQWNCPNVFQTISSTKAEPLGAERCMPGSMKTVLEFHSVSGGALWQMGI